MNVLFISLLDFSSLQEHGIYTDLLRQFCARGHRVFAVSPTGREGSPPVELLEEDGAQILKIRLGNLQKTSNFIKKGISTVALGYLLTRQIKRQFKGVRFDLVLYPTPPVTICGAVKYVKKRDGAATYLMLKDIFPQGAVDVGVLSRRGVTAPAYFYFRALEKKLYRLSDRIGCMSPANAAYIIKNEPWLEPGRVELCPNSLEIADRSVDAETRAAMREKYGIPLDRTVFVYGGNLGRPQGVPHLIRCLDSCKDRDDAFFLIAGDGAEYPLLEAYAARSGQQNVKLMRKLPKDEYDALVGACDVGLLFLDHRYTIPNFPSRLLSYMQAKLPVLACTDTATDVGTILTDGGFGWWCESDDAAAFADAVGQCLAADRKEMGGRGFAYMQAHYSVSDACQTILDSLK